MNWDRVEGNWKQLTGQAKEQWGKLTDDDLAKVSGKREQLGRGVGRAPGLKFDEGGHGRTLGQRLAAASRRRPTDIGIRSSRRSRCRARR